MTKHIKQDSNLESRRDRSVSRFDDLTDEEKRALEGVGFTAETWKAALDLLREMNDLFGVTPSNPTEHSSFSDPTEPRASSDSESPESPSKAEGDEPGSKG